MSRLFVFRSASLTPPIPTSEPETLIAGDTWLWERSLADYPPSDGWTAKYDVGGAETFEIPTTVVGNVYRVSYASSSARKAGTYRWALYVVNASGTRYTVERGTFAIEKAVQPQLHAEKMLGLVEGLIAARLGETGGDVVEYTIGGRSTALMTLAELEQLRARYQAEVNRIRRGGPAFTPIRVAFCA